MSSSACRELPGPRARSAWRAERLGGRPSPPPFATSSLFLQYYPAAPALPRGGNASNRVNTVRGARQKERRHGTCEPKRGMGEEDRVHTCTQAGRRWWRPRFLFASRILLSRLGPFTYGSCSPHSRGRGITYLSLEHLGVQSLTSHPGR